MRTILAGAILLSAAAMMPAAAQDYPWCAQYAGPMGKNCGFTTYEQCQATVRGAGGVCSSNPAYVAPAAAAPAQRKPKKRQRSEQ